MGLAPASWEQAEVKELQCRQGLRAALLCSHRGQGQQAFWKRPSCGFALCPGGTAVCRPFQAERHSNFLDNSGSKPLGLHSNYLGLLWEFWGTTWTASNHEPRIGTNRLTGLILNQTPILIFYKCNSDGVNVVFVFKQDQTRVDQLGPESNPMCSKIYGPEQNWKIKTSFQWKHYFTGFVGPGIFYVFKKKMGKNPNMERLITHCKTFRKIETI